MLHRFYRKEHASAQMKLELYNLKSDPGEKMNIADSHQYVSEYYFHTAFYVYYTLQISG